jgi:APA family basic amino acid/polyamine antiporter
MTNQKQLSLTSTVAIGLASMLGAGVFVVFREAFSIAAGGIYLALAIAALIAALNAASIYSLSRKISRPGGVYAYSRVYVGDQTSFVAGIAFVFGKIGSVAAIALVFAEYISQAFNLQSFKQLIAVLAIIALASLNLGGIQRTAKAALVIAAIVTPFLVLLATHFFGVANFASSEAQPAATNFTAANIMQAAALFFFAFAGYARVATLGDAVQNPKRNIPRAIVIALTLVTALYFLLANFQLTLLGPSLATAQAPLEAAASIAYPLLPLAVTTTVATIASLGSMLALLAGISRTAATMGEDQELPKFFAARNRFNAPFWAELTTALLAIVLVLTVDLTPAIGLSSFAVLLYYAIGHISVLRQFEFERSVPPVVSWVGLASCLSLMAFVPFISLIVGSAAIVIAIIWRAQTKAIKVASRLSLGVFSEIFHPSARNAAIIREEKRESRKAMPTPEDKLKQ